MAKSDKAVSKTQLARALKLTKGRVSQLLHEGLPELGDGRISLQAARRWYQKHIRASATKRGPKPGLKRKCAERESPSTESKGLPTLRELQRAREAVRLRREELLLGKLEGSLLDTEQVRASVDARFQQDSSAILNWPSRISAELSAALDIEESLLYTELNSAVRRFMTERAKAGIGEVA
jgi:hypothetical protein